MVGKNQGAPEQNPNGGDSQQNQKDDGQQNQKDDGQRNQKDDGQKNHKDNGQQNEGVVKAVDPNANTITVTVSKQGKPVDQVFTLPKDAPVGVGNPGKLGDLKPGMHVRITLDKDKKNVIGLQEVRAVAGQNIAVPKK